jgi:glucose uptake protein GlcU
MSGVIDFLGNAFVFIFQSFRNYPPLAFYLVGLVLVIAGAAIPAEEKDNNGKTTKDNSGTKYGLIASGLVILLLTLIYNNWDNIKNLFSKKSSNVYYY